MSLWSLRDHLIELFSILDNTPPFNNKEFSKCLTNKGIQHVALSLLYPQSNAFCRVTSINHQKYDDKVTN